MKKNIFVGTLISLSLAAIFYAIIWVVFTPALMWNIPTLLIAALCLLASAAIVGGVSYTLDHDGATIVPYFLTAILVILAIVFGIIGSPMPNAATYANSAKIEYMEAEDVATLLPTLDDIEQISLMETASAKKLGDRTLGSMQELVSQFEVSDNYYTIAVNNESIKIAPLEYGNVIKAFNHETIPGYVVVNTTDFVAEYRTIEGGMLYSPSDYISQDLHRHVQMAYPNTLLGNYTFQLDDANVEYWVYTTLEYNSFMGCKVPNGCIVVAADGSTMQKYSLEEAPEWVDLIFDGDWITTLYNRYGRYNNGFINFAREGQTQVTEDFGYIVIDNVMYVYTGVTSVGSDESNIGFILCNTHNGNIQYFPIAGAEEYSAMSAAEGIVQNYGYAASFPSLVMVNGQATYVMALKDSNELVKQYAMVNYANYTIAVVADTISECETEYNKALKKGSENVPVDESLLTETVVTIENIVFIVNEGNTTVYVYTQEGGVYRTSFDEMWLLKEAGNKVCIKYMDTDAEIETIVEVK